MSSASFTRDEVILALDVLYSAEGNRVSPNSEEMIELSELLNRLPIHPQEAKPADFRTVRGITQQIRQFLRSCKLGEKNKNVGKMFYDVAFEYEDRPEEIHKIAMAIRRNEEYYTSLYGNVTENYGFPEGALLGHLHHQIEYQANTTYAIGERCEVCKIQPNINYLSCGNLLKLHLVVPPEELDGGRKYCKACFITVCPTCHAALHRIRPWRNGENCKDILY